VPEAAKKFAGQCDGPWVLSEVVDHLAEEHVVVLCCNWAITRTEDDSADHRDDTKALLHPNRMTAVIQIALR
jgi:hypothetical protein